MDRMIKRASFLVVFSTALTALLFLILFLQSGLLRPYLDPNPAGFQNPQLWLQVAASSDEIRLILGPEGDPRSPAAALKTAQWIDFLFMIAYSALNASLFVWLHLLHSATGRRFFLNRSTFLNATLLLTLAVLLADVAENLFLLRLLDQFYHSPDHFPEWGHLLSANLKWGGLALIALLQGVSFAALSGPAIRLVVSLFYTSAASLILIALLLHPAAPLLEIGAPLLGCAWIASAIGSGVLLRRKK